MRALGLPPVDAPPEPDALAPSLLALLALGFVEIEGCVVLAAFESSGRHTSVARCHDETGYEAFLNHVHVEDLLPEDPPGEQVLEQAVHYVRRLAADLRAAYPDRSFVVVLGVDEGSANVRFHTVWPGQCWLVDDLETYAEPILRLVV